MRLTMPAPPSLEEGRAPSPSSLAVCWTPALSGFLKRLLVPIQEHAEYLGAKEFDWLRGQYVSSDIGADLEDEDVMTDDSEEDENVEDGTGSASEEGQTHKKKQRHQNHKGRAKKKKMHHLSCPEEPAGNALKQLKATIYQSHS